MIEEKGSSLGSLNKTRQGPLTEIVMGLLWKGRWKNMAPEGGGGSSGILYAPPKHFGAVGCQTKEGKGS